jgi:HK97 family phage portal protein
VSEERILSDIVWTPERGLTQQQPEVRGIFLDNVLLSPENSYSGKSRTNAGIAINPTTALQSTMVLACSRILAESISSLPLHVYRRGDNDTRIIANDIPLYRVLSFAPNSWQTKFEWLEQLVMTLCLWGNSYTQIKPGRYGSVTELINLHPSNMDVERLENGRLRYLYTNPETGRIERYTQDQIMHVRWTPEPDGIKGMVPIEVARDAIALARACEIHASKYWSNFARPGVVLQTEGSLSPEAAVVLRDNWERLHRGVQESWRTAVLTNGLKAEPLGFTNEQSQYIDSRRYQGEEISRVYRIPASLVQGTGIGNPEIAGQEFVTYTLVPWLRRIESAISRSLIYNDDLFFAEFDVKGLLRGDSNSRAGYYSTMIGLGAMSINEVRRAENMTPLGPDADHHFVAMNTQTLEEAVKPKPEPQSPFGGGPPAPAPGGPPSLPEVKPGKAPTESPKGVKSEPKMTVPREAVEEKRAFCATGEGGGLDNSCGKGDSPTDKPVRGLRRGENNKKQTRVARKLYQMGMKERAVKNMVTKLGGKPSKSSVWMEDKKIQIVVRDHSSNELFDIQVGYNGAHIDSVEPIDDDKTKSILEIAKEALPSKISDRLWGAGKPYPVSIGHGKSQWKGHKKKDLRAFCPTGEGGGLDNSCGSKEKMAADTGGDSGGIKSTSSTYGFKKVVPDITPKDVPDVKVRQMHDDAKFLEARNKSTRPENFTDIDPERLAASTKFISEDGTAGCLIDPDGDLGNVFNNGGARNAGTDAVLTAIEHGAMTLDCYDDWLPQKYAQVGFVPVAKVKWNDEFAPPNWNYERDGRPDVVIMSYQGGDRSTIRSRVGTFPAYAPLFDQEYTDDFDAAKRLARERASGSSGLPPTSQRGSAGLHRSPDREERRRVRSFSAEVAEVPVGLREPSVASSEITPPATLSEKVQGLIDEAREFDTESSVRIEFRDCGTSLADYDHESSTLYVSDSFDDAKAAKCRELVRNGWFSQQNPLMHELAHAFHARASQRSYEKSRDISFTEEQRAVITAGVSRFAATNGREFMAEFLAGAWTGREYSPEVVSIYESVLGAE